MRDEVERGLAAVRPLAEQVTAGSLRDGSWLGLLVDEALDEHLTVGREAIAAAHPGLDDDALADARIALAQRRAAVAGGLSAGAYATVVLTGVATGAGIALALPAALAAFAVDLFYTTRVQLQLGFELSLVYGVPFDLADPDERVDLVQTAFGVDADRGVHDVALGYAPVASRLGSRALTTAARLARGRVLAATGEALVRRGLVRYAFPAIGVPLCAGVNHYTTGAVGRSARDLLRGRARAIEVAARLGPSEDPVRLLADVVLLVARADDRLRGAELVLLEALTGGSTDHHVAGPLDEREVLARVRAAPDDERVAIHAAAVEAVALDGKLDDLESALLRRIAAACGVPPRSPP